MILEPIFEADFLECAYGFRPGRSAHQAFEEIRGHLQAGYQAVYDADLKGYFDSIPHSQLLACLRARGAYWEIDWFVRGRLIRHLQRRSQRLFHPPKGEAWYTHLKRLGLVCLARPSESGSAQAEGESFQESRTWEIRISGSTRGEWVAVHPSPSLLLYRFRAE